MPDDETRPDVLSRRRSWISVFGFGALCVLSVVLAQCTTSTGPGNISPRPPTSAPLPASTSTVVTVGASSVAGALGPVLGGFSSSFTVPPASGAASVTFTLSATQPGGSPVVQSLRRSPQTIGGTGTTPVVFMTLTSTVTVTLGATPSYSFTVPAGTIGAGEISYLAVYDPTANPQTGWSTFAGPGTVSGNTVTFAGTAGSDQLTSGVTYDIVLFTVTSALPTPSGAPTATPVPTPSPTASPSPSPTATASASSSPSPSPTPTLTPEAYQFGLNPAGSSIGIPAVGTLPNNYYGVTLGWPSSNASGVLVTAVLYALEDYAPLPGGNVFEMTLTLSGGPVTFGSGSNQFTLQSPLLNLADEYTMTVSAAGNPTTTTMPQLPTMGFPGTFLFFPSPFNGLTVASGGTVTVTVFQQ
jgi:hypothetical protein